MQTDRDAIGTALCVGGPRDGALVATFAEDPPTWTASAADLVARGVWVDVPTQRAPVCTYRKEVFHTPTTDFHFWLAEELSVEDLMVHLMTNYHVWKELP